MLMTHNNHKNDRLLQTIHWWLQYICTGLIAIIFYFLQRIINKIDEIETLLNKSIERIDVLQNELEHEKITNDRQDNNITQLITQFYNDHTQLEIMKNKCCNGYENND